MIYNASNMIAYQGRNRFSFSGSAVSQIGASWTTTKRRIALFVSVVATSFLLTIFSTYFCCTTYVVKEVVISIEFLSDIWYFNVQTSKFNWKREKGFLSPWMKAEHAECGSDKAISESLPVSHTHSVTARLTKWTR